MTQEIAKRDNAIVEQVVLHGDLAELSPADRVAYYARVCESLGLNPFTRPFEFIQLNNKLTLYARRDATDQLRRLQHVSVAITSRESVEGVYVVTAKATIGDRADESIGAVDISSLKGEFRANAMMKAETKAKRRVTLSIVGLGWLDETEISDIPKGDIQRIDVDLNTGEIKDKPKAVIAPQSEAIKKEIDSIYGPEPGEKVTGEPGKPVAKASPAITTPMLAKINTDAQKMHYAGPELSALVKHAYGVDDLHLLTVAQGNSLIEMISRGEKAPEG